jgi:serine/threonine-protein kinase
MPQSDPLIGQTIGSFRVEKIVGEGGMGRVYLAMQPTIGSRVAIKVLAGFAAQSELAVERFFAEARAVNLIRHEGIVDVLDLGKLEDGRPYIVMEYVDGAPLSSFIAKRRALPVGPLARVMIEVLGALQAAHDKGIVHRDLKPDNIAITPGGHAIVLDFGIAKLAPDQQQHALTETGIVLGTPRYMAPEQAADQDIGPATDLYSIGVILYEGMAGRVPFQGRTAFELFTAHVEQTPAPPRSLRPDLPEAIEAVILRALAKRPAERFPSAKAMAEALRAAIDGRDDLDATLDSDVSAITSAPTEDGLEVVPPAVAPAPPAPPAPAPPPSVATPVAPPAPTPSRPAWIVPSLSVGAAVVAAVAVVHLSTSSRAPVAARTIDAHAAAPTPPPMQPTAPPPPDAAPVYADAGPPEFAHKWIAHYDAPPGLFDPLSLAFIIDALRERVSDASLVSLRMVGMTATGYVDLAAGGQVLYTFRSQSHSAGAPGSNRRCLIIVRVTKKGVDATSTDDLDCDQPFIPLPNCTLADLGHAAAQEHVKDPRGLEITYWTSGRPPAPRWLIVNDGDPFVLDDGECHGKTATP